jgi:hypothetical protein
VLAQPEILPERVWSEGDYFCGKGNTEDMRLEEIQCLTRSLYRDLRRNRITEVSELEESLQSDHEESTMEARFRRALKALIGLLLIEAAKGARGRPQSGTRRVG